MHSRFTMPIYLHGSLQYFADVRGANAIIESSSAATAGGSAREFAIASVEASPHSPGAAAEFDLNRFMRWPA